MHLHRRFILPGSVLIYTLCLTLWFVLRLLIFDRFWWLALLNTAAFGMFLPLPLLIIAVIWHRRWRLLVVLLLPALIFAHFYGARFVPQMGQSIAPNTTALTAMTFNVLYRNRESQALHAAITSANPDILGVQEVLPERATWLTNTFATSHPYSAFRVGGPEAGVGLLSRYPITQVTHFELPPRNLALHAVINVRGAPVHVLVVHLAPNRALRTTSPRVVKVAQLHYAAKATETQHIIAQLHDIDAPRLLLCDCNLTETSEAYVRLAAVLNDSFHEAGWGLGFTSEAPDLPLLIQRVDYIWHSPEILVNRAYVGSKGGSDHRPVVAHLLLPDHPFESDQAAQHPQ